MKIIITIAALVAKIPGLYRLIGLGAIVYMLFSSIIPDLYFALTHSNGPTKLSYHELMNTPKDDLPRYMHITDALPKKPQASQKMIDSLGLGSFSKSFFSMLSGYQYVGNYSISKRSGDTSLKSILFPVYPIGDSIYSTQAAKLVVKEKNIKEEDLEDDHYFLDSTFTVSGLFDGDAIDNETLNLMVEGGYEVDKEAIVLVRGEKPESAIAQFVGFFTVLSILGLLIFSFLISTSSTSNG